MKTKGFLMLSLFITTVFCLIGGCSKQDDLCDNSGSDLQLKSADTRTIKHYGTGGGYWLPVICDGEIVDYLVDDGQNSQNLEFIAREHYERGKITKCILTYQGTLQSQLKLEVFTIHEQDKICADENGNITKFTAHTNAIGNMGTHLVINMIVDPVDWTYELTKAMCVPNSDN